MGKIWSRFVSYAVFCGKLELNGKVLCNAEAKVLKRNALG